MWSKVILLIKNFFGVSYKEARGLVIFFLLVTLFITLPPLIRGFYPAPTIHVEYPQLDSLLAAMNSIEKEKHVEKESPILFSFDPNEVSAKELEELGLDPAIASRWINYREAGARFRAPEDILRIYDLPEEWYAMVRDCVVIRSAKPVVEVSEKTTKDKDPEVEITGSADSGLSGEIKDRSPSYARLRFDINLADTSRLKTIYGIGPVLSSRIVKFRDGLGGFVDIDQLDEVYGLKPEVAARLKEQAYVEDTFSPVRLQVNQLEAGQLASHPYLDFSTARALVAYRSQHGKLSELSDLSGIHLLEDSVIAKLAPYLSFQ